RDGPALPRFHAVPLQPRAPSTLGALRRDHNFDRTPAGPCYAELLVASFEHSAQSPTMSSRWVTGANPCSVARAATAFISRSTLTSEGRSRTSPHDEHTR